MRTTAWKGGEKGDQGERVSDVDKRSRTEVEWNGRIMEARRIFD